MKIFALAGWVVTLLAGAVVLLAQDAPEKNPAQEKERKENVPAQKITTFLMFEGKAEAAMGFYISLFKNSKIESLIRNGKEGPGVEGKVKHATFTLNGQELMAIDSSAKHAFTFTPAISLYIKCETHKEIDELFKKLSEGGQVFMPCAAFFNGLSGATCAPLHSLRRKLEYPGHK